MQKTFASLFQKRLPSLRKAALKWHQAYPGPASDYAVFRSKQKRGEYELRYLVKLAEKEGFVIKAILIEPLEK